MSEENNLKGVSVCLVGSGNIGSALLRGLVKSGYKDISVYDKDFQKAEALASELNIKALKEFSKLKDLVQGKTLALVLALKPQIIPSFLKEEQDALLGLNENVVIISLAAGVSLEVIEENIPASSDSASFSSARVMPNLAMAVSHGYSGIYSKSELAANLSRSIFERVGLAEVFSREEDIAICTAIAGSGPAFIAEAVKGMSQQGIKEGLSPELAKNMALSAALAASKTLLESQEDLESFIKRVTTPGGTTEAGLKVMREAGVSELFEKAVEAASKRAKS